MKTDAAGAPRTSPSITATSSSLYLAIDELRGRLDALATNYENDGDLSLVVSDLGYVRDRADALQNAAIGTAAALEQNL